MRYPFRRRKAEKAGPQPVDSHQKNLARPSAEDIYKQVASNARQELKRSNVSLAISGFGGGAFMGFSALGSAIGLALLGASPSAHLLASMLYPLGFIVVIIGRAQLFTENTLYPVALVLAEKREFWNTVRLWSIVLPANIAGALAFSALAARTPALEPRFVDALVKLGVQGLSHPPSALFWSGVIGGWMIALAAWLVSGSHSITGSVVLIWMLTFVVGAGNFAHCIASSCEILVAVLTGHASWGAYAQWLGPAVAGNICGGVGLVTVLEYGQAIYGKETEEIMKVAEKQEKQLAAEEEQKKAS
ncbi:formate/nitrite transporter family protein [Occallatibacter riparius]|uniref:Formate/nitrite transporter family protein n=1 Tax=Occallatibacter riparius TaxID=1002689 RepID=A0A9J7BNS4_9BACT|nr:formate/nitrite transporter family protein [Occallatibacter riparius]UWZ84169.1 formate/nitrite transporter family protein [Occallatibacter riparius]